MPTPRTALTICLHRGTSFIGRAIRWQTRGAYSHASMILPDGLFVEAREFIGVRALHRLTIANGEKVDTFRVHVTDTQRDDIAAFVKEQLGKPYDYTMVLRFLSRRQAARDESGKWFCSELVFAALQQAGVVLLRDTQPWEVSPAMLARSPLLEPIAQNITADSA